MLDKKELFTFTLDEENERVSSDCEKDHLWLKECNTKIFQYQGILRFQEEKMEKN